MSQSNKKGTPMLNAEIALNVMSAPPSVRLRIERILRGEEDVGAFRLLTQGEVAKRLGLSYSTVGRMVKAGRLPTVETMSGRRRVPLSALVEIIDKARTATNGKPEMAPWLDVV